MPPATRLWAWLAVALTLALAAPILTSTLLMVWQCRDPLPFGDQWDEIVSGRPFSLRWLVSQHMEHRIALPRLVFWADRWLAQETNQLNYAVNLLLQLGNAALCLHLGRRAGAWGWQSRLWGLGLSLGLMFWAGQYQNFIWGFQVQFFGVLTATAASLAWSAGHAGEEAGSWSGFAGAALLNIAAALTLASGVLTGFVSVAMAVMLRCRPAVIAAHAALAIAILGAYLIGYHTPPGSSSLGEALHHPGFVLLYLLVVLGAPLASPVLLHATLGIGIAACAAAGALGLYLFLRTLGLAARGVWDGAPVPRHQAALIALCGFVVGAVMVSGAGRMAKGIESALVSRYTTPALVFWLALLLLLAARETLAVRDAAATAPSGRVPAPIMLATLPVLLLLAGGQGGNLDIARHWVALRRISTPAILAGVSDIAALRSSYAVAPDGGYDGSPIARLGPALRAAGSSVFAAPWAGWLGSPIGAHMRLLDAAPCRGAYQAPMAVGQGSTAGLRITGWLDAPTTLWGAPPRLLVADEAGRIAGYGLGGLDARGIGDDLIAPAPPYLAAASSFIAAAAGPRDQALSVYWLRDDGSACRLPPPG